MGNSSKKMNISNTPPDGNKTNKNTRKKNSNLPVVTLPLSAEQREASSKGPAPPAPIVSVSDEALKKDVPLTESLTKEVKVQESLTKEIKNSESLTKEVPLEKLTKEVAVADSLTKDVPLESSSKETIESLTKEGPLQKITKELPLESDKEALESLTKEVPLEKSGTEETVESLTKEVPLEKLGTEETAETLTKEVPLEKLVTEETVESLTKEVPLEKLTKEVLIVETLTKELPIEVTENNSSATVSSIEDTSNAAAKVAAGRMPVDLYFLAPSPPCRAVMMTARALGLDLNMKVCNVLEGDTMKPEFLKMNPMHTIPTINDNGFILWESRPIMTYLVNQYGKSDSLYPKNPKERAMVDQRLFFDMGTLYQRLGEYYFPVIFRGGSLDPEKFKPLVEAMGFLETMLEGRTFTAGDHLTLADISIVVTVSNLEAFEFDLTPFPNILAWYARTKEALAPHGYEEINQAGANILAGFYKSKLG